MLFVLVEVIPVRYATIKKRLNFLHYKLSDSMTSIVRQVYDTLKVDRRKGDFFNLVQKDFQECNIKMTEEVIKACSKRAWKIFITQTVKEKAFSELPEENFNLGGGGGCSIIINITFWALKDIDIPHSIPSVIIKNLTFGHRINIDI